MAAVTLTNATTGSGQVIPSITIQSADIALLYGTTTKTSIVTTQGINYYTTQSAATIASTASFVEIKAYGKIDMFTGQQLIIPRGYKTYAPNVVWIYQNGASNPVVCTDYYLTTSTETLANLKSGVGAGALLPEPFTAVNNISNSYMYWYNDTKCTTEPTDTAIVKYLKPLGAQLPYICVTNLNTYLMTNTFTVTTGSNQVVSCTFTDLGVLTLNVNQSSTTSITNSIIALLASYSKVGTVTVLNPAAGTFSIRIAATNSRPATSIVKNNGTNVTKSFVKQ